MEPQIQYARSADGTSIAFYEMGDGKPLIISSNIWNHLAMTWRGELKEASLELVRNGFHLVRYDMRGFGMSDRDVTDFSLDAQMADLEALREHLNLEQFALHGHVHASPACITYAARRPERLTHLLLTVPFARGPGMVSRDPHAARSRIVPRSRRAPVGTLHPDSRYRIVRDDWIR